MSSGPLLQRRCQGGVSTGRVWFFVRTCLTDVLGTLWSRVCWQGLLLLAAVLVCRNTVCVGVCFFFFWGGP